MGTRNTAPTADERAPRRVLDPLDRLSEVLFGVLMALSFTGSIAIATSGREDIREMLIGAIGCNTAWGIADAVIYLATTLADRGRNLRMVHSIRNATDPDEAHRTIGEALPPLVASLLRPSDFDHLRRGILALPNVPSGARLTVADFRGALGVFLLVFLSTFPLVVPFLFIAEPVRALRTSHAIAVASLYLIGHSWGKHSGHHPVQMGLAMLALGLVLVATIIALGG